PLSAVVVDALDEAPENARLLASGRRFPARAEEATEAAVGALRESLWPCGPLLGLGRSQRHWVLDDGPDLLDHAAFDLRRRDRRRRAAGPAASSRIQAGVVAVAGRAVTGGVRGSHGAAAGHAVQQALEQCSEAVSHRRAAGAAVLTQQFLDALPDLRLDDGFLLAGMDLGLVPDLAGVGHVGEQLVEAGAREGPAAPQEPLAGLPALVDPAPAAQLLDHPLQRAAL